jgi:hypothetical protein
VSRLAAGPLGALVLLLAAALPACSDTSTTPVQPPESPRVAHLLECRVDVVAQRTACAPPGAARGAFYSWLSVEAELSNERYTAADSTYRADVRLVNRSDEVLGTSDGTTVVGVRAFFELGPLVFLYRTPGTDTVEAQQPAVAGHSGVVTVRNPDGYHHFTAPDQPYFHYEEIIPYFPTYVSSTREWQFTVPPEVRQFGFTVRVYSRAPGEVEIPSAPVNAWSIPSDSARALFAAPNLVMQHPRVSGPYPRHVVQVYFTAQSTPDQRQSAVDVVDGRVVGGDGLYYYVLLRNPSPDAIWWAHDRLVGLPQVRDVQPLFVDYDLHYRRPNDGAGWQKTDWQIHPDSARGVNWAPEAIAMPGAWGCETGSDTVTLAVVDLEPAHGAAVRRVIAEQGNTGTGITGMLWRSRVLLLDASNGGVDTAQHQRNQNLAAHLQTAFNENARVINFSWGVGYRDANNNPRLPVVGDTADLGRATRNATVLGNHLAALETSTRRPLYVIAAGNYQVPAEYSGFPQLRNHPQIGTRVIVVAAHDSVRQGTRNRRLWANSGHPLNPGSNYGPLVHVAAPGANLAYLGADSAGTSVAAPHVAGIAGLLFSQDPRRTAQTVRSYITQGATRGGRWAVGTQNHRIVNAHESLRRAAEEFGAPLCGNRVWSTAGQIRAQRGTGVENIGPAEQVWAPYEVEPLHGGKHVWYSTSQASPVLGWTPSGWVHTALPPGHSHLFGGTTNSLYGYSHDRDTLVWVNTSVVSNDDWWRHRNEEIVPYFRNVNGANGSFGNLTVTNLPLPDEVACLERIKGDNPVCTIFFSQTRVWLFRIAYPQNRQPVVATVSPIYTTLIDSTAWGQCALDQDRECRHMRFEQLSAGVHVYTFPYGGGTPTLLTQLQTGGSVYWIGQSEADSTLVLGRGVWDIKHWFDPELWRQTGNGRYNSIHSIPECGIEYRALAGFTLDTRIETTNVCNFHYWDWPTNPGGGTIAPLRAPSSAGGGSVARVTAEVVGIGRTGIVPLTGSGARR